MRIAQVCYLFSPAVGGVETHVLNIGGQLVEWGHGVDVLTSDLLALNGFRRVGPPEERIRGMGVRRFRATVVARTRAYSQRIRFPGVFRALMTGGYDVVHCHSIASLHFDLAFIASRLKGIPLVVTGHYSPGDLDRLWTKRRRLGPFTYPTARLLFWRTWMAFALGRTERIIAIAESEKERLVRYFGVPPERITVVPNGVNPDEFDAVTAEEAEGFRASYGMDPAEPLVLFVGRISRVKGPDLFAEAAGMLLERGMRAKFMLVGHPEDQGLTEELRATAAEATVHGGIQLAELPRRDVVKAFKAADIVVLPSRGEVFGITLVEGMYCGKVVVGSDSGGIPEVIDDGRDGFLFRSGDAVGLAELLGRIIPQVVRGGDSPDGLEPIRAAAKAKVLDKYTWANSARMLLAEYGAIV